MQWLIWGILQLLSYDVAAWLAFVAIAICAARFGSWPGVVAGCIVVATMVFGLDLYWIRREMIAPGWDPATGPDQDIIFFIGVCMRVVLINVVLLPVSVLGLWWRTRRLPAQLERGR